MDREAQLIERIAKAVPSIRGAGRGGGIRLGIGDDAAILTPGLRTEWVLSCDAFLEGVHFLTKNYPPDSVGYKSLVRAASDLAAMGAMPRIFLLTLALPARLTGKWLGEFAFSSPALACSCFQLGASASSTAIANSFSHILRP